MMGVIGKLPFESHNLRVKKNWKFIVLSEDYTNWVGDVRQEISSIRRKSIFRVFCKTLKTSIKLWIELKAAEAAAERKTFLTRVCSGYF